MTTKTKTPQTRTTTQAAVAADGPLTPYTSPLEHLEDHLRRIAALISAHVTRVPRARRDRSDDGETLTEDLRNLTVAHVPPQALEFWALAEAMESRIAAREALTTSEMPLLRLVERFGLSKLERDVLLVVAAGKIDPRYADSWRFTSVELQNPTVQTVISILARDFAQGVAMRRMFSIEAPLFRHSLLLADRRGKGEAGFLDMGLELPRRISGELMGDAGVPEELVAFSRVRRPEVPLAQVVLPPEIKGRVMDLICNHDRLRERRAAWGVDGVITYGKGVVLLFSGPPGTGKTMLANAIAHELGKRVFLVDAIKLVEGSRDFEENLDALFREAKMLDAVLFFDECEQLFTSRLHGNPVMPLLLSRFEQFDGFAILATNLAHHLDEALARRILARFDFTAPSAAARQEIWRNHLPPQLPLAADVDLRTLAEAFDLSGGLIKNAVLAAVIQATSRDASEVTMADLEQGARLQVRVVGDAKGQLVDPVAQLADVVLPPGDAARLRRFVASARARGTVLVDWGLGRALGSNAGLAALFMGPSGTGKSMAAEAVAHALGRPMLRCDLVRITSAYVGETSKNLEALFQMARQSRAVLVFDEADALFARRTAVRGAQERFANAEVGALLTQLERHDGVVILTTNLGVQIDPAFERRLHVKLAFPLPAPAERARIWQRFLACEAPWAQGVDAWRLARNHELTGGGIRAAVLNASLEAASQPEGMRVITHEALDRAAREQAPMFESVPATFQGADEPS